LLHQFTFLILPSLQVCFHHMSYNQCFDVNSERKKETITGNLISKINLASNKKFTTLSVTRICKFLMAMKWISCKINHNMFHSFHCLIQNWNAGISVITRSTFSSLVFCVVFCFVCLRPVSYVSNVANFSVLSILDRSFGFL
jgi:hypothetical protein